MQLTTDEIRRQLAAIRQTQEGFWNIEPAEGEYFRELVESLRAQRVLEIGTSNGYSGAWFALGLRETGGRLITLEADPGRYQLAQQNFAQVGLTDHIDSRLVDALQEVSTIESPLDIVFIDAWKPDYVKYYEAVLPKVRSGGIILAHNVVSHASELGDYLGLVETDTRVRTEMKNLGPQGLAVSTKL